MAGLAICCAVMYVTADGSESMLAVSDETNIEGATGTGDEKKVVSVDVQKVGTIVTSDVPTGGRWILNDYFKKVEKEIASEVASRKTDIENIRNEMAKNRAYNAKARATMKHMLLARMATNAKQAKDDLDAMMRKAAKQFAAAHALENSRHKETMKRSKQTRAIMRKNKKAMFHQLHMATLNQQRALAALDSATNAKISQTQKNIAANGAQITSNAIKARKDLDEQMNNFDKKMFNVKKEAKKGRSDLAAQALNMDKKVRADIDGRVRSITAFAVKEFQAVRATMAKDRHDADMKMAQSAQRMTTALNAERALQNSRFAETVADIAEAKAEASAQVKAMKQDFKIQIVALSSVVKNQVTKMNNRVSTLQGVVTNNKLEQAKVNQNVDAELKHMVKVGNDRETKLAGNDAGLSAIIKKNKADTQKKMDKMATDFYGALSKIRKEMAKDRQYNEKRLGKSTAALFATLATNQKAQDKVNTQLSAATKAADDEARRALSDAKRDFSTRLGALASTVDKNDKKANKKIENLTGIVSKNAAFDMQGRKQLKALGKANKLELQNSINDAVAKGEKRAKQVEKLAKDMNKKTRDALSNRISTEIGVLTKKIHSDVEGLQLQTAEARKAMKAEILNSLRDEEKLMKKNLGDVVAWSMKKFVALDTRLAEEKSTSSAGRNALKESIAKEKKLANRAVKDAVTAQARSLMALKTETAKAIKDTNTKTDAYGAAIVKHAKEVAATMAANEKTLDTKLASMISSTKGKETTANAASLARSVDAMESIRKGLKDAKKLTDKKFKGVWETMGKDRAAADKSLGAATKKLNDKLAKATALEDSRFAKSVKDLSAARKAASDEVQLAKKDYTMSIAGVTASVKKVETRILGEIQIVAKMVIDERASQARVNKKVDAEIKRVIKLSDSNFSESKRARGKIKEVMDKNKVIAAQEVSDLRKSTSAKYKKLRAYQAKLAVDAKSDLSKATTLLYEKMAADSLEQTQEMGKLSNSLNIAKASTADALKKYKGEFKNKMGVLANTVSANHKSYEQGLEDITKVQYDWQKSSTEDRVELRKEAKVMGDDLNKDIVKAIQIGEARAKEVLETSMSNINVAQRALSIEIGEQVERMADTVLKTVVGDRSTIANNYLSVKGYAGAAADTIMDYIQKGEGKGLSSIGDFLQAVAVTSAVKTKPSQGLTAGSGTLEAAFGGELIHEVKDITKVNGLVDEYSKIFTTVNGRWPFGLGRYLLSKLSDSMAKGGILKIGAKSGSSGQYVHVDGKALGLSHKMGEFSNIGCRLVTYQSFLTKLTSKLPKTAVISPITVAPPEWQGN